MGWSSVARHPFTTVLVKGLLEDGLRAWVSYVFIAHGGRVILTRRPRDIFQLLDKPFLMPLESKVCVCEKVFVDTIEVDAESETPKASAVASNVYSSPSLVIIATISLEC
jgi:hypothetical protein